MKAFTFEDELALRDGIRNGLGEKWFSAHRWIKVYAHDETVDVFMEPPATKPIFRQQELILSAIPDDGLMKLGSLVGHEMAVFLSKNKRYITPAALDD